MVVVGLLIVALLGYMYADSLMFLVGQWGSDDYSHGMFVPFISGFLMWQRLGGLRELRVAPSWSGPLVVLAGLLLYTAGNLATLYVILHLSFWLLIVGLVLSFLGIQALRGMAFPLIYLLTAIPLPVFLHNALSSQLQLWSSALGVGVLQFIGVTAFREGNMIDLGPVQLQVAEACSGIRYLFPLTALALLCAYFFRDRSWKRVLLVLSALPISVLVNGLRIGIVGVLVEWYGPRAAEGFLHLFEGWVLFFATLVLLLAGMWFLSLMQPMAGALGFLDQFRIYDEEKSPIPEPIVVGERTTHGIVLRIPAYVGSLALVLSATLLSGSVGNRQELPPERTAFVDFASQIGNWQGSPLPVEPQLISALRFDDYLLADYTDTSNRPVTLYMAYYGSQRKGQSAHSPSSCIPGGGWEIISHRTANLALNGFRMPVNRVLIQKDRQKQLVFYWFKQRDRILSSEYLVKFYLLWDSLVRKRSDGALVRVSAAVEPGENEQAVEDRILRFAQELQPQLSRHIPD